LGYCISRIPAVYLPRISLFPEKSPPFQQVMPNPTKHIAFVMVNLRPGIDGAATAMLELMHYVKRIGFEASVFNFLTGEPHHRALMAQRLKSKGAGPTDCHDDVYHYLENEVECHLHILPFTIKELESKQSDILKKITEVVNSYHLDYLLTVDHFSAFAAYALSKPGCHLFHSLDNIQQAQKMHPAHMHVMRNRDIATVSSFLQGKVKELLGLNATVLNPGIDFDSYITARDADAEAIGFYATKHPAYKGNEVVQAIIEQMPERKFLIIGREYKHDFATLPANVTYAGFQNDIRNFYQKIKVLLVPSLVPEGFPRIILEAAANGIPAIANNLGGIPEALGHSGVLIELDSPGNPDIERLAHRYVGELRRLFDKADEYEALRQKALLRARHYATELEHDLGLFLRQHVP
jgi:glycosyltransferase involved in cell wall biosynthesis